MASRHYTRAGVPAGAVQNAEDLYFDLHLRERGHIRQVDEPDIGPVEYPGSPVRYSDLPSGFRPLGETGEHNEYVYGELLGVSSEEIRALQEERVIA